MSAKQLDGLGVAAYHDGCIDASARLLRRCCLEAQNEGDLDIEFLAQGHRAEALFRSGELLDSVELASDLATRARRKHDVFHEMRGLALLAMALERHDGRRRWTEVQTLALKALDVAHAMGTSYWMIQNLETLSSSALRRRDFSRARCWLDAALASIVPGMHEEVFFALRLYQLLAELCCARGDADVAFRVASDSVALATDKRERVRPHLVAGAQLALAKAEYARGNRATAAALAEQVLATARERRWRVEMQGAALLACRVNNDLARPRAGEQAGREALALAQSLHLCEEEVTSQMALAHALELLGQREDGAALWQRSLALAQERGYQDHSDACLAALAQRS